MATALTVAQLQNMQNQISSGQISLNTFYQTMNGYGYKYALLADGVVSQNSVEGVTALNFMKSSAQQQGITLDPTMIANIEKDMAIKWLKALAAVAGSSDNPSSVVNTDLNYYQTQQFHSAAFSDFGLKSETWTLYTPGQVLGSTYAEQMWQKVLNGTQLTELGLLYDMGNIAESDLRDGQYQSQAIMWEANIGGAIPAAAGYLWDNSLNVIGDFLLQLKNSINSDFPQYLQGVQLNTINSDVIQLGQNVNIQTLADKLTEAQIPLASTQVASSGSSLIDVGSDPTAIATANASARQQLYNQWVSILQGLQVQGNTSSIHTVTTDSSGNKNDMLQSWNAADGKVTVDDKQYANNVLLQDANVNSDGSFTFTQYGSDGVTQLFRDAFNKNAQVTKEEHDSNIKIQEFETVTATALASQVIAQFIFKNNLPASTLAQAFTNTTLQTLINSNSSIKDTFNALTDPEKFVASYGIGLAGIASGIAGSVAGVQLFKALGLPSAAGSVVGGVVSQQALTAIISTAKTTRIPVDTATGAASAAGDVSFATALSSAGGAAIGNYLGLDASKLIIGQLNDGASFGGAVGGAVGAYYGTVVAVGSTTLNTLIGEELGTTVGNIIIPGIGALLGASLGSFLGSVIGSVFGPGKSVGPNASASIAYNGSQFYFLSANADNGGDKGIATNLANAAIAETNGIAAAIGGHIVQKLGGFGMGYYQKTGFFAYFNPGDDKHNVYSTPQAAIDNAIIRLAHMETIQGGNPFMEYALAHSQATTVAGLVSDLNAAHDYGQYLANPLAFDTSLALTDSQSQLDLWTLEMNQAKVLGLGTAPNAGDLNAGILTETSAYVNAHLELLNDFRTSGLITGITLTEGAITVNANQASQYNNLISLISNRNSITVMDTIASISANIITLNSLTANNLIASVIITDSPSSYLNNTSLTIAANKIQTVTGYGDTVTASTGDTLIFNSSGIGKNTLNAANGDTVYFYGNASTVAGGVVDNVNLSNGLLEAGKGACLNLRGSGDTVIENANVTLSIFGNNNGIRGADGETIYQDLGGGYNISVGVNSIINLAGNGTTGATGGVDNVTLSSGRVNILPSYSNVAGADVVINGYSNSIAITSADNIIINGGGNNLTASGTLNSISISGNGSKGANGGVDTVTMSGGAVNLLANADAIVSGYGDTVIAAAGDTVTFNSTSVGGSNLTIGTGATVNFSGNASLVANGIIDNVNASGDVVNVATGACFNLRGSNDSVIEGDNATLTVFGNNNGIQGGVHETIYQDLGGGYNISVGVNSIINLAGNGTTGATGGVDKISLSSGRVNLNASNSTVTGTDATISGNNNSIYAVSLDTVSINGASDTVFVNGSGDVVNIAGNGQTLNTAMLDTVNISSGTVNVASYASAIINGNNNTVWTGNNSNANVQGNNDTVELGSSNVINVNSGTGNTVIAWGNNDTVSIYNNGQDSNTALFDTVNLSSGTVNVGSYASAIVNGNNDAVWTGNNSNANVQGNNDTVEIGSNNVINIGNGTGDSLISWGNNNTITGANGDSLREGGGGNNTYKFARGNGSETITKNASSGLGSNGELDFASGIATNQLWFLRNGNNLQIDVMGTHDQVIVANWFGSANSQFKEIKTSDGSMIDAQLASLVQTMGTYSVSHSGFNPTSVNQFPADTTLQNALNMSWHH